MAASNGNEKRKHPRVEFKTPMKLLIEAEGKEIHLEGKSTDLSLRGVFVSAGSEALPVGAQCRVNIYLSGGVEEIVLPIKGSIVRESDAGTGIVFDSMDVDTYSHLKNIVYYNRNDDPA